MQAAAAPVTLADTARNGASIGMLYGAGAFFSLMLHVPALMLAGDAGRIDLFAVWFVAIEGGRLAWFLVFARMRRDPAAMLLLREISLSPRTFLPAAMLFFVYASAPPGLNLAVAGLWLALEYRAVRTAGRVDAATALRSLKRSGALTEVEDGRWVYRVDDGLAELLDKTARGGRFMRAELTYVALPFAVAAPALFLTSQRAGGEFDIRALIAGGFCLVIGWFTLPVLAGSRISRRALRALAADGRAAFGPGRL